MFVKLGAHLIRADDVAHELMQPGQTVYDEVVRRFGREILHPDGSIHRGRLASLAFGTPGGTKRVAELNSIVHPAVMRRGDEGVGGVGRPDPAATAIVEAGLRLGAGGAERFYRVVGVTAPPQ